MSWHDHRGHVAEEQCKHEHTRIDPRPWPTGEDLEICLYCGMSRTHWEQGASEWQMVDVEQVRLELETEMLDGEEGNG